MLGFSLLASVSLAVWSLRSAPLADGEARTLNAGARSVVVASLGRRPSHNGRYEAEIVESDPLAIGRQQRWMLHVTQGNHRALAHADVRVISWAPETGERSPRIAATRYVGGGNYRLSGICFPRAGWWNVALVIDGSDGVDSVAFNVVLPRR